MYLARWQRLRTSETTVTSNDHPSGGDPAGSSQKALTLKTPKDVRLKPRTLKAAYKRKPQAALGPDAQQGHHAEADDRKKEAPPPPLGVGSKEGRH